MMKLTEEQQAKVREWAAQGASLNDIHKRIVQELGVAMTYMDARLLVADLQVSLKDKNPPPAPKPAPPAADGLDEFADGGLGDDDEDADLPAAALGGSLKIGLDAIAKPRTLASGRVTFSDGAGGNWYIDEMGRLGMDLDKPGYRPSEADVVAFQRELQTTLQRAGY
jgi:hypothetical protein